MALTKINTRSLSGTLQSSQLADPLASGNVIRMGSTKLTQYADSNTTNTWATIETFTVPGITAGNTVYLTLSINDLLEAANTVYWRILTSNSTNLGQYGRNTNPNGGWRGVRSDITVHDYQTGGGTRTYTLQNYGTAGSWYYNYPSGDSDCASFLTWYEIKA
jgi:hypothetical protein